MVNVGLKEFVIPRIQAQQICEITSNFNSFFIDAVLTRDLEKLSIVLETYQTQ